MHFSEKTMKYYKKVHSDEEKNIKIMDCIR